MKKILFLALCLFSGSSWAGCAVTASGFVFSNVGNLNRNYDTTGSVRVQCDAGTAYTVGNTYPGDPAFRLKFGTSWFNYLVHKDPARTQALAVNGSVLIGSATAAVDGETYILYGRIPNATQKSGFKPGSYSGNIPLIVVF